MRLSNPHSTDLELNDVLSGQVGAGGIRELVHDPMRHGLADLLSQCVPGREHAARVELLRTKYKPGRKLTAYYRLHIDAEVRPIALSWSAEVPTDTTDAADAQERAAPRHLVEPFERLSARTHGGRTGLLISPIDPAMPQLMRLNDHSYLTGMIKSLATDPALPAETARIQAVRYRPGQRHVLHVAPADDDHRAVFVKIDRDNRGAQAVRFAQAAGPLLAERSPRTSLVTPLGYAAGDQAAVWRSTAGATLSDELGDSRRAAPLLTLVGNAVRVLHDLDCRIATPTMAADRWSQPHDARLELASTLSAGQHVSALLPDVGERYRQTATEVLGRLEDLPQEPARPAHGDLKADNILAAEDRICLLDLDRSGLADPAIDLGKMLADLRWWGREHSVEATRLVTAFLEGYGSCDPARLSRARLIAVLFHLKFGARRIPVQTVGWDAQVTRQVAEATAGLRGETPA